MYSCLVFEMQDKTVMYRVTINDSFELELDYRLDVCRVTQGAHIEHL
jgi:hypothetical protein